MFGMYTKIGVLNWRKVIINKIQYEIFDIVDIYDNYVDVKFLASVKGFKSVY